MSNLRITRDTAHKVLSVTGSSQASTTLAAKNAVISNGRWWRTVGDTGAILTLQHSQVESVNVFALYETNLTLAGTVEIERSNVSNFSTLVYEETFNIGSSTGAGFGDDPFGNFAFGGGVFTDEFRQLLIFYPASSSTAAYTRFKFEDATNPDGFIQIRRVYVGDFWSPALNPDMPFGFGWNSDQVVTRSPAGLLSASLHEPYRSIVLRFSHLTMTEAADLMRIRRNFLRHDTVIDLYPAMAGEHAATLRAVVRFDELRLRQVSAVRIEAELDVVENIA